jgi:hypothetical protein
VSSKRWVRPWAVVAVPLRFFYPQTASPGLSPVVFPSIQTSRLHLPAPLGSPGITRLHRYYECCDSCAWTRVWPTRPGTHPLLDATQVSPLHGSHLPGSPSPSTPPLPRSLWHLSCQRRRLPAHRGSGLHLSTGGSPVGTAESSSHDNGLPVRLALLPTPPHDDAVTVGYRTETGISEGDFHLSDVTRSWTHDGRVKADHDGGDGQSRFR